jgi:hypothetical protein
MISTCAPLFDDYDANYEIEDALIKAGVINDTCEPDSEMCALVVNFKNKRDGVAFIGRLNKYLKSLAE